jgi:phosphoribosylformylglycinamidine cyclo-ligase
MSKISYKSSGVDIDEGNKFIELIKPIIKSTFKKGNTHNIGSFSGLYPVPAGYKKPYLVSATDGVGTKLKIASMLNKFDTIGIDLVAMNVNDIITCGAKPLFFLDYIATSKIKPEETTNIVKGITLGCKQSGCVLIGGETAEMPDLYKNNDFDLAGFVVGIVDKSNIIDGSKITNGDSIIGLQSSGLHSNGYSLIRHLLLKKLKYKLEDKPKPLRISLGKELLKPTRIYVKTINNLAKKFKLKGIAHITGGGLIDNIPRILPDQIKAVVDCTTWNKLPIYSLIERTGQVDRSEMLRTFNCGIGMVIIVSRYKSNDVLRLLKKLNEKAFLIGEICNRKPKENKVEFIY